MHGRVGSSSSGGGGRAGGGAPPPHPGSLAESPRVGGGGPSPSTPEPSVLPAILVRSTIHAWPGRTDYLHHPVPATGQSCTLRRLRDDSTTAGGWKGEGTKALLGRVRPCVCDWLAEWMDHPLAAAVAVGHLPVLVRPSRPVILSQARSGVVCRPKHRHERPPLVLPDGAQRSGLDLFRCCARWLAQQLGSTRALHIQAPLWSVLLLARRRGHVGFHPQLRLRLRLLRGAQGRVCCLQLGLQGSVLTFSLRGHGFGALPGLPMAVHLQPQLIRRVRSCRGQHLHWRQHSSPPVVTTSAVFFKCSLRAPVATSYHWTCATLAAAAIYAAGVQQQRAHTGQLDGA
jgi:hypothetical protein